ncbi:hypothetical protein [Bacteroides ihuae]|uniref:hypothetical protein n=1 Tax=Bacteroides ihuae TaxID=1852362 RepID=UPI0008DAFED2|nr:hypothetical protein [Bacteroides ihuae]
MNRVIINIVWIICATAFASCQNQKTTTNQIIQTLDSNKQIRQLPDSIRMKQEGKELERITKVIVTNLKVVNNHLYMPLNKDEFIKLGIPEHYYDTLIENLKDANKRIDSLGIKNMKEILNESYKDLYEKYEKEKQ